MLVKVFKVFEKGGALGKNHTGDVYFIRHPRGLQLEKGFYNFNENKYFEVEKGENEKSKFISVKFIRQKRRKSVKEIQELFDEYFKVNIEEKQKRFKSHLGILKDGPWEYYALEECDKDIPDEILDRFKDYMFLGFISTKELKDIVQHVRSKEKNKIKFKKLCELTKFRKILESLKLDSRFLGRIMTHIHVRFMNSNCTEIPNKKRLITLIKRAAKVYPCSQELYIITIDGDYDSWKSELEKLQKVTKDMIQVYLGSIQTKILRYSMGGDGWRPPEYRYQSNDDDSYTEYEQPYVNVLVQIPKIDYHKEFERYVSRNEDLEALKEKIKDEIHERIRERIKTLKRSIKDYEGEQKQKKASMVYNKILKQIDQIFQGEK